MAEAGIDPVLLSPVAEEAVFKSGVRAGEHVVIETRVIGSASGAAVLEHAVSAEGRASARVVTIRRLAGEEGESALLRLR